MAFLNINVSAVNIHSEPGFNSAVVSQALLGESCIILDRLGNWYKIRQEDEYEGWIYHFFGIESEKKYEFTYICDSMFAPVLNKKSGNVLRDICYGNRLQAVPLANGYSVTLPDGESGWTSADLRSTLLSPTRQNIIKTAKRFSGTPYQWGGKSPAGIDCSGFTQTVFSSVGINLPRDAHQQADYLSGFQINVEDAQEGDLLFFSENQKISHVAISLGSKEFIHAQGWVKEQSLDDTCDVYNKDLDKILSSIFSVERLLT